MNEENEDKSVSKEVNEVHERDSSQHPEDRGRHLEIGERNGHKGRTSIEYQKVDFKGKVMRGYGGYLLSIIAFLAILLIIVWVLINKVFHTIHHDFLLSDMGFRLILTLAAGIPLIFFVWVGSREFRRFLKSGSAKIFIDFSLSLLFIALFSIIIFPYWMIELFGIDYFMDFIDLIWPVLSIICMIPFFDIIITAGILYSCWAYSKGSLLGLYPQVIASAERETDEYLDGYSDRPFEMRPSVDDGGTAGIERRIPEVDLPHFRTFARFLMKHQVIYDYFTGDKSIKLVFPRAIKMFFLQKPEQSWMRVKADGRVTIYITPADYDFLKVPISYHLLCEKTWERIWSSYQLFQEGKKKSALDIFTIEKVGKKKRTNVRFMKRKQRQQQQPQQQPDGTEGGPGGVGD